MGQPYQNANGSLTHMTYIGLYGYISLIEFPDPAALFRYMVEYKRIGQENSVSPFDILDEAIDHYTATINQDVRDYFAQGQIKGGA